MEVRIKTPIDYIDQLHTDAPIPRVGEWVVVHKVGGGDTPLRVQDVTYEYINNHAVILVK